MDRAAKKTVSKPHYLRGILASGMLCLLASCVSYEPAVLIPALTLSPEDITLRAESAQSGPQLDFGLDLAVNESDSLFNVETLPGVLVRDVAAGGPADAAGIRVGDVILAVGDTEVNQPDAVTALAQPGTDQDMTFRVRRGTTVFDASVSPRALSGNPPPRELYRLDPLASRAGYRSRVLDIAGMGSVVAAEIVDIGPASPLPAAGINVGDLILAIDDGRLSSAQDLVTRLNRDYELGETVGLSVYDGSSVETVNVKLWDPGRRISRFSLGPLLRYESELNPPSRNLAIIDLWLFAVYRYRQVDGERSHSLLGLFNFTSNYGELVEEQ